MNTSFATDAASAADPMTHAVQQPLGSTKTANDVRWWHGPRMLRGAISRVIRSLRSVGPYVAIELLLPGGSIIALALWTYSHRRAADRSGSAMSKAVASITRWAQIRCATPCTQR